jgi:hypothetical protein
VWTDSAGVRAKAWSGGAWGGVTGLAADGDEPQVAMAGDAVAVWTRADGTVQASAYAGGWGPATDLGADGSAPQVAIDARGEAFAVWEHADGVTGAVRPRGGAWTSSELSTPGLSAGSPQIAVDGRGSAAAIWEQFDRSVSRVRVSVFEAATPVQSGAGATTAIAAPAPVPAGHPAALRLTGVRLKPARIHKRGKSKLTYRLNLPARVQIMVRRGSRRATRRLSVRAGTQRIAITARYAHRRLKPGRYRVTITATPAGGKPVSATRTLTILSR